MQLPRPLSAALASLLCLFSALARAQEPGVSSVRRTLPAVKAAAPPALHGDLSDPAWKTAPKAERFYDMQQGGLVADQTTAYIFYDEKYIYIAFYCKESQPDQIVARETVRDSKYNNSNQGNGPSDNEDNVEVTFDPFLTHRDNDFARFSVNAIGTLSSHVTGGRANKMEWKGDWDAAVKRVADGWTCEMRIPWAGLNYPNSRQPVTMGLNFRRFQYRTRILSIWSNIGPQGFNELEGTWTGVQVPQGAFHPKLSLLPYTLPGLDRTRPTLRSGLDARYTITPELTAVGSLNPDFATIEGAVEGIAFSRTERFVPERRPFFLEGRDYFNFFSNGNGPYFYSNHIRTFDIGTKVYGKITPVDSIGVLNTVTFGGDTNVVTHYRRDFSPTAGADLFFTQRHDRGEDTVFGLLDQSARWGAYSVETQYGESRARDGYGETKQINFNFQDPHGFAGMQVADVSPGFQNPNGLVNYTDWRGFQWFSGYFGDWRHGPWRHFFVGLFPTWNWHFDGRPFRRNVDLFANLETRSDWGFGVETFYQRFDDQTDATISLSINQGISNRFRQWGISVTTGRQADRPSTFVSPSFSVRVLRRLDIAYGGAVQNLDGVTHQQIVTINYELSPNRSFGGRVVVQDSNTNWYVSYRNSGAKGTEIFFILGDPNALRFTQSIAVKFVFAI